MHEHRNIQAARNVARSSDVIFTDPLSANPLNLTSRTSVTQGRAETSAPCVKGGVRGLIPADLACLGKNWDEKRSGANIDSRSRGEGPCSLLFAWLVILERIPALAAQLPDCFTTWPRHWQKEVVERSWATDCV